VSIVRVVLFSHHSAMFKAKQSKVVKNGW